MEGKLAVALDLNIHAIERGIQAAQTDVPMEIFDDVYVCGDFVWLTRGDQFLGCLHYRDVQEMDA